MQPALLPVNMYDWVAKDHFVWFVISVIEELDLSGFECGVRPVKGRPGYDPVMMVTLLVYAYCCGLRSSRQIEARCRVDLSFRVICGGLVPDHTTICRFRRSFGLADGVIEDVFTQVLAVCAAAGLGRLSLVAGDGTKIAANASKEANRTETWLRDKVVVMLAEAAAADEREQVRVGGEDLFAGQLVPAAWRDPSSRAARIAVCLADLEATRRAGQGERDAAGKAYLDALEAGKPPRGRVPVAAQIQAAQLKLDRARAAQRDKYDTYWRRYRQAEAGGGPLPRGGQPRGVEDEVTVIMWRERLAQLLAGQATVPAEREAGPVANVTDPGSRLMKTRNGFIQGYNAQIVAADDRLILDAYATTDRCDQAQAVPLMNAATEAAQVVAAGHCQPGHDVAGCHDRMCDQRATGHDKAACHQQLTTRIGTMLLDAGYCSEANLTADGPDRLIATGSRRTMDQQATRTTGSTDHPADHTEPSTAHAAMDERLRTEPGRAAYKRRSPDIEGVNSSIKNVFDLHRFMMRGLRLATFELKLTSLAHNLTMLSRTRIATS